MVATVVWTARALARERLRARKAIRLGTEAKASADKEIATDDRPSGVLTCNVVTEHACVPSVYSCTRYTQFAGQNRGGESGFSVVT